MNQNVSFKKGRIPRNELELPTLHFVVMDQWVDVIGEKALFSWLKMYTWCKRDEQDSEVNLWEQAKIPTSMNKIIKKLGVGRDTFYNKILKPLWNVGLIDIEEYQDSVNEGLKPMNVIVYKYPQNEKSLSHQPIKIIRDYNSDYHSEAKTFTKKGGRPKNKNQGNESISDGDIDEALKNLDEKQGSSETELGLFSNRTRVVPEQNYGMFSNGTMGSSQMEHNNIFNSINNSFNTFSNSLNNFNNLLNMLSNNFNSSSIKTINIHAANNSVQKEEEEDIEIAQDTINYLETELNYSTYTILDIVKHMKINKINRFTDRELLEQNRRINKWVSENKQEIREFGYFFVNGILKHQPSRQIINHENELKKQEEERISKQTRKKPKVPFYNWLEENNESTPEEGYHNQTTEQEEAMKISDFISLFVSEYGRKPTEEEILSKVFPLQAKSNAN